MFRAKEEWFVSEEPLKKKNYLFQEPLAEEPLKESKVFVSKKKHETQKFCLKNGLFQEQEEKKTTRKEDNKKALFQRRNTKLTTNN